MSLIDEALRNRLINDANVTALVAQRIYLIRAPQGATMPCLTFQKIDTVPTHAYATTSRLENSRFQFDSWAKTPSESKSLADKVKSSLDGYIGVILGVTIYGILLATEIDYYEQDAELFRVGMDFKVLHKVN